MKRFCTIFLTIVLCTLMGSLSVFAAPETVAADAVGNTYELVVVTKPQNQKDSTFDAGYMISGYGKEGTTVTLYRLDANENVYRKIYNETRYVDAAGTARKTYAEASATIGASGLFMNTVNLTQGTNNILVRAEKGDSVQLMKISVTKYNYNLFDIIKSLTA